MDYIKNILCVQLAAGIAETITFPIDYVKTHIQLNTSNKSIIPHLKIKNIYNGLSPSLKRHMIYTTLRINIYDNVRNYTFSSNEIINKICVGGISGGVAQLVASPFDLLKIRHMTGDKTTLTNIIKREGFLKLWKGASPNVSRAVLVNLGELSTYDLIKHNIKDTFNMEESTRLHVLSSLFSGLVATFCCTPADVVKSRLMVNDTKYEGVYDCIRKTLATEGIRGMYKGFVPIYLRLAPWQIIFWTSYETFRSTAGLDPF